MEMLENNFFQITIENDITVGPNTIITAKALHEILFSVNLNTNKVKTEINFLGIEDIKFLGNPVEGGYDSYKKFKRKMEDLDVDLDSLVEKAIEGLIPQDIVDIYKEQYKNFISVLKSKTEIWK